MNPTTIVERLHRMNLSYYAVPDDIALPRSTSPVDIALDALAVIDTLRSQSSLADDDELHRPEFVSMLRALGDSSAAAPDLGTPESLRASFCSMARQVLCAAVDLETPDKWPLRMDGSLYELGRWPNVQRSALHVVQFASAWWLGLSTSCGDDGDRMLAVAAEHSKSMTIGNHVIKVWFALDPEYAGFEKASQPHRERDGVAAELRLEGIQALLAVVRAKRFRPRSIKQIIGWIASAPASGMEVPASRSESSIRRLLIAAYRDGNVALDELPPKLAASLARNR